MNKKRNYWPLLFIGIFVFTLGMIIWTIYSAIKVPVNEDETFLKRYHNLDQSFNEVISSNEDFKKDYTFKITINKNELGLITKDIFYSQRVLEKKSKHKNIFKKGINTISFKIINKANLLENTLKINFRVTRATNNKMDMNFTQNDLNKNYDGKFNIDTEGNWNITGIVETKDGKRAYFYIKSNTIY